MFKLESYITPLLLSYVDKYIKNLKPEDSQVFVKNNKVNDICLNSYNRFLASAGIAVGRRCRI